MSYANPSDDRRRLLLEQSETIAIVGASSNPERPSHGVMKKLLDAGYHVVPVNPNETEVLGQKAYESLASVPFPIDIVDVFRRVEATPEVAEAAARALAGGLAVVMDECIGVAHSRLQIPTRTPRAST